jgi:hypothetical protein
MLINQTKLQQAHKACMTDLAQFIYECGPVSPETVPIMSWFGPLVLVPLYIDKKEET